jgi:hypothetical protein
VRDLTHDLLTLEATGDYPAAQRLLETMGVMRPNVQRALGRLQGIPTDIEPIFVTADELTSPAVAQPHAAKKTATKRTSSSARRRTKQTSAQGR